MQNYWGFINSNDLKVNNNEIVCQNCGWHWKVKDGGDDLYVCHECNTDNSKFYLPNSKFEGADPVTAVAGAVGDIANLGSGIQNRKANKELSKSELQKEIDTRCGKDRSRSWNKKRKKNYKECKSKVLSKIDADFSNALKIKSEEKQDKFKQENKNKELFLSNSKKEKQQTYIIIGIVALILGIVYINKIQAVNKPI